MGLRLLSVFVLVAVCSQSQTVSCNDLDELGMGPKGTQLLKHGLAVNYTNLDMTPEEKALHEKYVKCRKRMTKSLAATVAMYLGGIALAAVGAAMAATPNSTLVGPGLALGIPGAASFVLGTVPLSVMGVAGAKGVAARRALIDLAKQRVENNRRHDILSSIMKRAVVSKEDNFVGEKPRVRSETLQLQLDASGKP